MTTLQPQGSHDPLPESTHVPSTGQRVWLALSTCFSRPSPLPQFCACDFPSPETASVLGESLGVGVGVWSPLSEAGRHSWIGRASRAGPTPLGNFWPLSRDPCVLMRRGALCRGTKAVGAWKPGRPRPGVPKPGPAFSRPHWSAAFPAALPRLPSLASEGWGELLPRAFAFPGPSLSFRRRWGGDHTNL